MDISTFEVYVRKPFAVLATKITEENIDALAKSLGEVRVKDGEKYIALDRRIVPTIPRAHIGYFVTRMNDNLRCYSPKVFKQEFMLQECNPVTFTLEPPDGFEELVEARSDAVENHQLDPDVSPA